MHPREDEWVESRFEVSTGGIDPLGVTSTDDVDALIDSMRPGIAFTLGAMGSAETNFYNDAFRRAGFEVVQPADPQ